MEDFKMDDKDPDKEIIEDPWSDYAVDLSLSSNDSAIDLSMSSNDSTTDMSVTSNDLSVSSDDSIIDLTSLPENHNDPESDDKCRIIHYTFECSLCNYGTQVRSHLTKHVMTTHSSERNYKCDECPRKYRTQRELKHHLTEHTGEPLYKCNICMGNYVSKRNLRLHQNTMHFIAGEKSKPPPDVKQSIRANGGMKFRYHCKLCSFKGQFRGTIKRHMAKYHYWFEKKYKCEFCPMMFDTQKLFGVHVKSMHADVESHKCRLCAAKYTQPNALTKHEKEAHFNEILWTNDRPGISSGASIK